MTPIERSGRDVDAGRSCASWGLTVANLTASEARELVRDSTDGVRVVSLRPERPGRSGQAGAAAAATSSSSSTDTPVRSVADLEAQTKAALGRRRARKCWSDSSATASGISPSSRSASLTADDPPRDAKKAWVPVSVQVLTPPLAERLGLKGKTGVRVTRLLDDKTPLRVGDIILAIDGEPVRATAATTTSCSRRRSGATASASSVDADGVPRRQGDAAAGDARGRRRRSRAR